MTNPTCSALTRTGHPCRAHPVRDSHPPLCVAHGGRRTLYDHTFTPAERAGLETLVGPELLDEEIEAVRVLLRRLLELLPQDGARDPHLFLALTPLILDTTARLAELLQDRQALNAGADDDPFVPALRILGEKWGVDLLGGAPFPDPPPDDEDDD